MLTNDLYWRLRANLHDLDQVLVETFDERTWGDEQDVDSLYCQLVDLALATVIIAASDYTDYALAVTLKGAP